MHSSSPSTKTTIALATLLFEGCLAACLAGCSTRSELEDPLRELERDRLVAAEKRFAELEAQITTLEERTHLQGERISEHNRQVARVNALADEAARRARQRIVWQEAHRFELELRSGSLPVRTTTILTQLVERLRAGNDGYRIFINSDTNPRADEADASAQAAARAETIRKFLHQEGVPLHLMRVVHGPPDGSFAERHVVVSVHHPVQVDAER